MQIRHAIEQDIPALCQLMTVTWQSTYRGIFPDSFLDNMVAEKWAVGLQKAIQAEHYYVAEEDSRLIGMLSWGKAREPQFGQCEIYVINVLPDFQGKGVGQTLLQFALTHLQNSMPIYLKVVTQNEKARRFYEKQGLICTQQRTERTIADFSVEEVVYQYL